MFSFGMCKEEAEGYLNIEGIFLSSVKLDSSKKIYVELSLLRINLFTS